MCVLMSKKYILPVNTSLAIKGEIVFIELPRQVDLRELDKMFYICGGRLNLAEWK